MLGLLLPLWAASAHADEELRRAPADPPRWRLRASLTQGIGGARDGDELVTVFPTTLEFNLRLWGPLAVTVAAQGVTVGSQYLACGEQHRSNAAIGTGGVRVDFANGKAASWAAPFLELHGGLGGQSGGHEIDGICRTPAVFATVGAKLGLDVWLGGKVAVTVAVAYDYLPTAAPISAALGAAFVLY